MIIFKGIEDRTVYEIIVTPDCPIKARLEKEIRTQSWELIGQNEHWILRQRDYEKLKQIIEEERKKINGPNITD